MEWKVIYYWVSVQINFTFLLPLKERIYRAATTDFDDIETMILTRGKSLR